MTPPDVHCLSLTRAEADQYVHGLEQVLRVWHAGNKRDRHLQLRYLHAYNAVKKLIGQLKAIAYPDDPVAPQEAGPEFDLELARENEEEARTLDVSSPDITDQTEEEAP